MWKYNYGNEIKLVLNIQQANIRTAECITILSLDRHITWTDTISTHASCAVAVHPHCLLSHCHRINREADSDVCWLCTSWSISMCDIAFPPTSVTDAMGFQQFTTFIEWNAGQLVTVFSSIVLPAPCDHDQKTKMIITQTLHLYRMKCVCFLIYGFIDTDINLIHFYHTIYLFHMMYYTVRQ